MELSFVNRTKINYKLLFEEFKPVSDEIKGMNSNKLNKPFKCPSMDEVESSESQNKSGPSGSGGLTIMLQVLADGEDLYTVKIYNVGFMEGWGVERAV